jgi:DNA repair protein RecN (Recombination protein N)
MRQEADVLRELSVQNLALIEDVRVELQSGYCAWTGETGAGKSLLLTALGLVLGGKAAADLVRTGRDEARAAAVFELADPALRADLEAILGGPIDDDSLIITRRISTPGRSSAHVNGLPVTIATLRALGERLIDVHGQHESRALLDRDRQRDLLDAYGGLDGLRANYRSRRDEHERLRRQRQALVAAAEMREREQALLAFERDELTAADPRAGEYGELAREAHRLANAEALRKLATEGYALLYEADHSAHDLLAQVARRIEPLAASVAELGGALADLHRLADETREVARTLQGLVKGWDDDPARLEEIEARMALYRRLAARFHCDPDDLPARLVSIEERLAALERDEADLRALDAPLAAAWHGLKRASAELSEARRKTCRTFARAVQAQLKALNLGQARITVEVESDVLGDDPAASAPAGEGLDHVELVFTPNPGEAPRPLRRIASGGELSRLTLAVKTVLAEVDRVPTLIFDEIDAGVGGRLGAVLGKKLAALGRHHQVICVTHLPQMASFAQHQWVIRKRTVKGRTQTTITPLTEPERVDELAAMLRGDSAAEGTREEARAMLVEAQDEE